MQKPSRVKWPARFSGRGIPQVSAFMAPENPLHATAAMAVAAKTVTTPGKIARGKNAAAEKAGQKSSEFRAPQRSVRHPAAGLRMSRAMAVNSPSQAAICASNFSSRNAKTVAKIESWATSGEIRQTTSVRRRNFESRKNASHMVFPHGTGDRSTGVGGSLAKRMAVSAIWHKSQASTSSAPNPWGFGSATSTQAANPAPAIPNKPPTPEVRPASRPRSRIGMQAAKNSWLGSPPNPAATCPAHITQMMKATMAAPLPETPAHTAAPTIPIGSRYSVSAT